MNPVTGGQGISLGRGWGFLPAALVVLACGGEDGPTGVDDDPEPPPASSVWVEPVRSTVPAGEAVQLVAFVKEPGATDEPLPDAVTWSSSNDGVATVGANGVVTAVGAGTATVTGATSDGGSASADITVGDGRPVWTQIEAEGDHRCGITTDGEAYCWGDGSLGKLGNGSLDRRATPTPVAGGHTFASISVGPFHVCGVTESGDALCWGEGEDGQLGNGTLSRSPTPSAVSGGLEFASVTAASDYTCALSTQGEAFCWGTGADGRLGNGSTDDTTTPTAVLGDLTFQKLDAGGNVTCGITDTGQAYCWGLGLFAQVGDGRRGNTGTGTCPTQRNCRSEPYRVATSELFSDIASNFSYTCAVALAGVQHCWGGSSAELAATYNSWDDVVAHGFLGFTVLSPTPVSPEPLFTELESSGGVFCGLDAAGAAHCWGGIAMLDGSAPGSLGDGTKVSSLVPVPVSGGHTFTHISVGSLVGNLGGYGCGVTPEGRALCWGGSWLSDGTIGTFLTPVQVADP